MKLNFMFLFLATLVGCSSANKKVLDQKMEAESVDSRAELKIETKNSIDNAVNLTQEQKQKLNTLRSSVSKKIDELNKQSLELRSILVKNIVSTNYNSDEVSLIKVRMRKLEDKKLMAIFKSIDEANQILGRQARDNRHVMQEMIGIR